VVVRGSNAPVWKLYCLDSQTKLLARTQYSIRKGGSSILVVASYSNWQVVQGNAIPGQIVRTENGVTVFTLTITGSSVAPLQNDSLFTHP
jgi:hypothetical protein